MTAFRPIRPVLDPGLCSSERSIILVCRWSVGTNSRLRCRWERSTADSSRKDSVMTSVLQDAR